ncbi:MAG: VWA domain-containing protein [Prevotella sp.]|nr:VWA domain-containing protein [Prevotella sp.]
MKRVFNLIIVDESGSMSVIRKQAFSGMNETLSTVRTMQDKFPYTEQRVTLVTFDSDHMKWHYNDVLAKQTHDLSWRAYNPCAATPLYDAIGKTVSKLNAQVRDDDNVLVTIITDGEENCSGEWTLKMVRNLIEKLKTQKWTFTLIGTDNLDVEGMAHAMSIDEHLDFKQDAESTAQMFANERKARIRYNLRVEQDISAPTGSFFKEVHSS